MYLASSAMAQYKKIGSESGVQDASPHRLIQMLMNGALDRLIQAKGAMARQDISNKGLLLGKAISILAGLQSSLDKSHSHELVANLEQLYDYMQRRLLEANVKNDEAMIDEVIGLLKTVKSAWDELAPAPSPTSTPTPPPSSAGSDTYKSYSV